MKDFQEVDVGIGDVVITPFREELIFARVYALGDKHLHVEFFDEEEDDVRKTFMVSAKMVVKANADATSSFNEAFPGEDE